VAIICASAPALHPLLVRIAPKFRLGSGGSRKRDSHTPPTGSLPIHMVGQTSRADRAPKEPARILIEVRRSIDMRGVSWDGDNDESLKNMFDAPWEVSTSADAVAGRAIRKGIRRPSQSSQVPIRAEV
jgi:hypothetical protein